MQDGYIEGIFDGTEPAYDEEPLGSPEAFDGDAPMFDSEMAPDMASDVAPIFDASKEGFFTAPDMDPFGRPGVRDAYGTEQDYFAKASEDAPSDTGSFLGGGDTAWATELIGGDDADHGMGYAGGEASPTSDGVAYADYGDAYAYDERPSSYGDTDMPDVTAMDQRQFMTPVPVEQMTFHDPASAPEAPWAENPADAMPPMAGMHPSQNGMGDDMYQQQPQDPQRQQQPPAPIPPAPMPAPAPPLVEEHERHEKPKRERHHGRIFRMVKRIILLLLLILAFVGGFSLGLMYEQNQHPSVSAAFIETQLSECSDLATAKMHYNGLVHYEDGDIPLINKKSFSMTYQAEVRAGIDLSQADVKVSNGTITITLPQATVQTTAIDPASVKFFDQTWGLFSWESKDDAKTALEQAQKDLDENLDDMRLVDEANLNAERTVRGLIAPILKMNDGYKLEVKVQP